MTIQTPGTRSWPALRVGEWTQTRDTFHLWTQVVGKVRLQLAPAVNHWWHVPLYVSARGLTTGAMPYGDGVVDIEFDLVEHRLVLRRSDGQSATFALEPMSVAAFYARVMGALSGIGVSVRIHASPNEVDPAIPFADDTTHTSYDPEAVESFWRQLVLADRLLTVFRSRFTGKVSPVHFFWGALDIAVTRFSGRPAPRHPGGAPNCPDSVMIEGYSHELSSAGFWPGGGEEGAFYSYAYPAPEGYEDAPVPSPAYFDRQLGEFLLPWEAVRTAEHPEQLVLDFLQATFDAAATLANWPAGTTADIDPR